MDNGACLYYKLTNEPKGSGELKKKIFLYNFYQNTCIYSEIAIKANFPSSHYKPRETKLP